MINIVTDINNCDLKKAACSGSLFCSSCFIPPNKIVRVCMKSKCDHMVDERIGLIQNMRALRNIAGIRFFL